MTIPSRSTRPDAIWSFRCWSQKDGIDGGHHPHERGGREGGSMTRTIRSSALVGALAAVGLIAAACGEPGQSGAQAPPSAVSGEGCAPVAGDQLVVLVDDRGLQTAENIVPAVHGQAATPDLLAALNAVSAVLDTPTLVELNKAVDIDRKTPPVAAEEF